MTTLTSKLGADMDDPEMNTLVIQTATAAGLRVNVDGKMLNDNYTNVMGSFPSLVRFARALLARQPAAIDNEADDDIEEAREILENMVRSIELDSNYSTEATCTFLRQALNCLPVAAPLANEASKPAVAQCDFDLSLAATDAHDPQSFINGARWALATCPTCGQNCAAPLVEQDERGADHD